MSQRDTLTLVVEEIALALAPLQDAVLSPERFVNFMAQLGWEVDGIPQPLQDLAGSLTGLIADLQHILTRDETGADSLSEIGALLQSVQQVFSGIKVIGAAPDAAFPPSLIADDFKNEFPAQLLQFLIMKHLRRRHPQMAFILRALGVMRIDYSPSSGNRRQYMRYRFDFSDLPELLHDPSQIFKNAYGWGTDTPDYGALFQHLENLLLSMQVDVTRPVINPATVERLAGGTEIAGRPKRRAVAAVFFERIRSSGRLAAELLFLDLPGDGTVKPGLAILPRFNGPLDFRLQLGDNIAVTIDSSFDVQGGVGLILRPERGIDVLLGFENGGAPTSAQGSISVRAEYSDESQEPITLLGSPDASRLEFKNVSGTGGLTVDFKNNSQSLFVELELQGGKLVIAPGQGDGFLQAILPQDGIAVHFDLAAGISTSQGFYFRGSGGLELSIPTHLTLGPVELQSVTIGAEPSDDSIPVNLGASIKAVLGPLTAVVENMGLQATFSFPDDGGNAGPVDFALAFKPPTGVGLSIDAGMIKGGGFLRIDPERGEYSGTLELTFSEIVSLKAIGLITTRMPDGSNGFSLLIIITAEFGAGIQLGYGFKLLGVGGLLGLNRTMKLQPLMEGIRTGAVESIMFPHDVIANAPRIISDLRTIFPPREGIFLIGPMAKLGWGTPTLISISLGIIIEIPGNLAILGILKIAIPAEEIPLIVIQVNFAGAIEFDRKRIYFFAALFESRIVFLTIEGEMGLLMAFGDDANFVISVGGFHPRFSPPPLPFPSPRRIAINLLNTPVARVRIEGYFAITSNTVQFGARIEVFFGISALSVQGHLAFDALFQFSPFYFIFEISASLSVRVFGIGLFSVGIRGSFDGPAPYHIKGHGSISLLFWDISVPIEKTWGESRNTEMPPIPVMPILEGEINKADNWRALLPAANNLFVSLRKMPAEESAQILHPVGVLHISQRALPLEIKLDKVGSQKPNDVNRLSIAVIGTTLAKKNDAFEQFAPAQFQNFSDSEKLTRPAFAPERSGLDLSAAGSTLTSSVMVKRIICYEEIIIDNNFKRFQRRFRGYFGSLFNFFLAGNAAARCQVSVATKAQFQPFAEKIEVATETFTVAFQSNNQAFAADSVSFHSEASARDYVSRKVAEEASLADEIHVIPSFERAA